MSVPPWPCPTCANGRLWLVRDSLIYKETTESRRSRSDEDYSIIDVSYAFAAWLECRVCNDKISCCGIGGYEPVHVVDEEGSESEDYELYFVPKYFSKPMLIFRLPLRCPAAIKEEAIRSFAVLFCDLAASANHIRQCVENILSHSGIEARNARGNVVPLGRRIGQFRTSAPENSDRASALRWIGNFGSHPESLRKDDLFDAYDILEVLLEDLFVGHQRSVRQMIEQINERRGPRR